MVGKDPAVGLIVSDPASEFDQTYFSQCGFTVTPLTVERISSFAHGSLAAVIVVASSSECMHSLRRDVELIRRHNEWLPIMVLLRDADPSVFNLLSELRLVDAVTSQASRDELCYRLRKLTGMQECRFNASNELRRATGLDQIVGKHPAIVAEKNKIVQVAEYDINVLITGETGSGKEVFARAIHYLGRRADHPFVPINCGTLPHELVENELFGHEAGAYTGSSGSRAGLLAEAAGGTVFLDEIDSLLPMMQMKLLRFLQEKEYRALGSTKTLKTDARVIAATNADLEEALSKGRVRSDLFYRLNGFQICIPSLRKRRSDIPLLAAHFVRKHAAEFRKPALSLSASAVRVLVNYDWPGNVRELENTIRRALLLTNGDCISEEDLLLDHTNLAVSQRSFKEEKAHFMNEFEKEYIIRILTENGYNITHAAQSAGKDRRAFWQLMRKHRIDVNFLRDTPPR